MLKLKKKGILQYNKEKLGIYRWVKNVNEKFYIIFTAAVDFNKLSK